MDEQGFYLLPRQSQAHDHFVRLQCLSRPDRKYPRRARVRADELRDRCARSLQDAEGQGVVKLAQGVPATEETKQVLMAYCRKNVAKYAMPYDIEFKEDMPKTLVGKVAYRQLEEEELSKLKAQEEK